MNLKDKIEDTYAEAFEGIYCRIIVTADDEKTLKKAAEDATATPAIVVGRTEGGIEKWLNEDETSDGRKGAILQFWGRIDEKKPFENSVKKFEVELSYRIRQDILVKPFTAVFDASIQPIGRLDMMEHVGHCGDGYEWEEKRYGRQMIIVPIMVPDFQIERYLGYGIGIMGANFWYMCKTKEAVPWIGPTTNHLYCPSLKEKLGPESKVPEDVGYIPEIVINGITLEAVKKAMKAGIEAVLSFDDVVRVSAGNYGGKLGKHKIYLQELL